MTDPTEPTAGAPRPGRASSSRRQFLFGGAIAGVGAAVAIGASQLVQSGPPAASESESPAAPLNGAKTYPFYGAHQAGVETAAPAHGALVALDLHADVDRARLRGLLRMLTDDAARLTQGAPALADTEPELAATPAGLTVTFGFGPELVRRAGAAAPDWLRPLPAFTVDRLEDAYSGGDLLLQIGADEPLTVAHTVRMLLKDTRSFAEIRWIQHGFRRAHGSASEGTAMRNLFGQVDETVNPSPGSEDFAAVVWSQDGWMNGGTSMVVRRIHMNLDTWDELDRPGREQAVGRTLDTGAPLTGKKEHDEPDFTAVTPVGFPVIPEFSHLRRARSDDRSQRIFRRSFTYDDPPSAGGISNAGLIFVSFQADVDAQFVPIQRRIDELDLLNKWITPIGSAVFAIPPGCAPGGFIGEGMFA